VNDRGAKYNACLDRLAALKAWLAAPIARGGKFLR